MSNVCLRTRLGRAENGAVRVRILSAALTIAILCVCQSGRAQYGDRDGRIVRYRPYRIKDDLVDRGVVTDQVFERILDYIIAHREKQ